MPNDTTNRNDLAAQLAAAGGNPDRAIPALADGLRCGALTDPERRSLEEALRGAGADAPPPALEPLAEFAHLPEPAPVLWRDPAPDEAGERSPDAVLSVGEVAVFASAGGLGKSTISIALAHAAASGDPAACGLRVRAGPAAIVNYEDSPVRMAHRLKRMGCGAIPDTIRVWSDPSPLFEADPDERGVARRSPQWEGLFEAIRELAPSLLIVDPATAALADLSGNEGGPVRAFMRAMTAEAERGGFGVLIVAHDTKSARNAAKDGADPGAGAVAGSATWYDAARGVLYMRRDPNTDDRLLASIKANHGRSGWGARLTERYGRGGRFEGFELTERMDREAMDAALTKRKADGSERGA